MSIDDTSAVQGFTFATTPEWILDAEISDRAVRLFGVLNRYVGAHNSAWPSRKTLAARLRCSSASVDRAIAELVRIGALVVERRYRTDGSLTSSLYWLWPKTPPVTPHPGEYLSAPVTAGVPARVQPGVPARVPTHEGEPDRTIVNESLLSDEDVGRVSKPREPYEAEFEDAWLNYPRKEGKIAAYRAFVARVRAGAAPTDLRAAAFNYEKTRRGQDTRYTKLGSTFWGPTEPWRDYLPGGVGMAQVPKTPEEIDAEVVQAFVAMTTMFGEYRDREIPRPVDNPLVEALLRQHPLKRWGQMSTEEVKYALQAVAREGGAK